MGHTARAAEGREGRSRAGPKGHQLEVGARRAPKLLVIYMVLSISIFDIFKIVLIDIDIFKSVDISTINISYRYIEQGLTETPQKAYLIYGRCFISK